MRLILLYAAMLLIGAVAPARAQIFQIEVDGVITGTGGIFASVPIGTPYAFATTFNAGNATLLNSTSSSATYADPNGTSSFTFGGFSFSGKAPQILVTSDEAVTGATVYGFEFTQLLAVGGYAVQLISTVPSVAPTTSLPSLHAETFSEYQNSLNLGAYNTGTDVASGHNTSFSVQVQAAPEPASIVLAVFAIATFGWLRRYWLRENA